MSDQPDSFEHVAADLLNGVMLCLLGAAAPVTSLWLALAHWDTRDAWIALIRARPAWELAAGAGVLVISLVFMVVGARHVLRRLRALRDRRSSPTG